MSDLVSVNAMPSAGSTSTARAEKPTDHRSNDQASSVSSNRRMIAVTRVALLILGCALLWHAYRLIELCIWAIHYPYDLDYVEGLLWEQMRLFKIGRAYAPIDGFPAISFPYPPFYYLASGAMAWLIGSDGLAAGRAVSMVSLLMTGIVGGAIVHRIAVASLPKSSAFIPAAGACLILLSTWPVLFWAPLMRVDMLALCFSLSGVYFAMMALDRHRWVLVASLCFLLAVYTKHNMIAAPAASFAVLLLLRPKTGLVGILVCLGIGLAALAGLEWATNGGAVRHLFGANVSRVLLWQLEAVWMLIATHSVYVGLAAFVLLERVSSIFAHWRGSGTFSAFRARLMADRGAAMSLILIVYLALATPMLLAIVKAGSSLNYLLEWTNIVALFCGLSLVGAARTAGRPAPAPGSSKAASGAALIVVALAAQALVLPSSRTEMAVPLPREAEMQALSRIVRAATKPIISDDMVILVRNGKEIYIEPAFIGEGSRTGAFDQRPLLKDILSGKFSFFLTAGNRGDPMFDSRYSVEAAEAMDVAYPCKIELPGRTIHLPAHHHVPRQVSLLRDDETLRPSPCPQDLPSVVF
jgi:hypothetical protein